MRFAIIAAGEGSRLAQEGVSQPKPLVAIHKKPMIERLLHIFIDCGATEIVVIINEWSIAVKEFLESLTLPVPLRMVIKTTPSSMHSLHEIAPYLRGEKFCLTTVDTIFREEEFKAFIHHFVQADNLDGCMAVTPFVDDEKPLWVGVDANMHITGFHDAQEGDDHLISGGIYCLGDKALNVLEHCMEQNMTRMRNFQRQLVAESLNLEAYSIPKVLDVDHKDDIAKAEAFLYPFEGKRMMGVCRGNQFSPNCVTSDQNIMNAVAQHLRSLGADVDLCDEQALVWGEVKQADVYFSMARSAEALQVLEKIQQNGVMVVNPSVGVKRCVRSEMTRLLLENGVSYPNSWIVTIPDVMPDDVTFPCWLKRGDGCAQQKEDTCYVQNLDEAYQCLEQFWKRGVTSVVINEHLQGDLIKFYGVRDTDFFYWIYPHNTRRSKFGLEAINGTPKGLKFDTAMMRNEANNAAKVLDTPIYGGDCIVRENGDIIIIDFNDWPSFAPCVEEAAINICKHIEQSLS